VSTWFWLNIPLGTDPSIPDTPGLREARPWTNRDATSVRQVPKRLVVIGGGPTACELAQALHALGAEETTMLVRGDEQGAHAGLLIGPPPGPAPAALVDAQVRHRSGSLR
jgi:NADPH-dependent 2,4-dienoyl-CoA reductase/sulfur reductase-like enzyme